MDTLNSRSGWLTRIGAFILFLFVVIAVLGILSFIATHTLPHFLDQLTEFVKNSAIIGALLYIMAFGAGKFSFDHSRS